MNTASYTAIIELLFKWVQERDKSAFKLQYGYGVVEEPWLTLSADCKEVWSGTLQEFKKWVSK